MIAFFCGGDLQEKSSVDMGIKVRYASFTFRALCLIGQLQAKTSIESTHKIFVADHLSEEHKMTYGDSGAGDWCEPSSATRASVIDS